MSKHDSHEPTPSATISIPGSIAITMKHDKVHGRNWESIARVMSLVAIPVVLAIVGGLIQRSLNRSDVQRDYVRLAVSVLTTEKDKASPALREWAVDLLNENSPTKFSNDLVARLKAGEISLPIAYTKFEFEDLSDSLRTVAILPGVRELFCAEGSSSFVSHLARTFKTKDGQQTLSREELIGIASAYNSELERGRNVCGSEWQPPTNGGK